MTGLTRAGGAALDPDGIRRLHSDYGSAEVLEQLIVLFATQTSTLLTDLDAAIAAGDAASVAAHAHKLKGSCLTLAATEMADLCDQLGVRAAGGSIRGARELVCRIQLAFAGAHRALLREAA